MNRRINLTGKNSNDIYSISYPKNLLYFMRYDFNLFMERSVDLCKLYMKTGEYRPEEAAEIRNSVSGCHKYFEQNIRGAFEKIVIDCWVEFICRQNEIGVITLWNNYIPCRNDFEKAIFGRLSEYRHGHAINQWVNILKVQEYANIKVDFIFGEKLKNAAEAAARANYFDLMFNVVANELGYDLNHIADNKVYTIGRTPNSPFVMSNVSREIVRNLLADLKYGDDKTKIKKNEIVSDQTAMDAFSSMKAFLPSGNDNIVETMIKSLAEVPMKVYIPASLKAAIDLEIDTIIENQAFLQRCELCKDYYMRCEEYDFDYCDRASKSGRSCIEVMSKKTGGMKQSKTFTSAATENVDPVLLNERCERLYKEMSGRININFTQRDFSDWCRYLNTIRENVINGEASLRDFESFVEYSRAMSFLPSSSATGAPGAKRPETKDSKGRTVKPFVFERVDRRDLELMQEDEQYLLQDDPEEEPEEVLNSLREKLPSRINKSNTFVPQTITPQKPPVQAQTAEEDIKIYRVKSKEPEEPKEYVKVFKPKKLAGGIPDTPIVKQPAVQAVNESPRIPAFTPAPALSLSAQNPEKLDKPVKPAPTLNIPSAASVAERREQERLRKYEASQRTYASQKAEETQEMGFADMLRGIERRDGFSDDIQTDSDGMPVSHKTKRVMEALFKQSKPSLSINVNKGEE